MELHIKNMVCLRCINAVRGLLSDLEIQTEEVRLGQVLTSQALTESQKMEVANRLRDLGFELLEEGKSQIISRIKTLIIEHIHGQKASSHLNLSTLIAEDLHYDYSYLSRLFSSVAGITIERYALQQRVEKIKELLFYDELTLSEIAYQLNYSSVAHLSTQFKKETGMTPSQFRASRQPGHGHLDKVGQKDER